MTRRVALIGKPLRRRHSAVMHDAAFDHFGINARYEIRELEPADLEGFVTTARGPDWLGFQVTAPYKRDVMAYCDRIEPEAAEIGAINSVLRQPDGVLVGFNTDMVGFVRSVGEDLGLPLEEAEVVVAGAGGAARAVVAGCLRAGAKRVLVGNRTLETAEQLAESIDPTRVVGVGSRSPRFAEALGSADLAVNATTVGMTEPDLPFDPNLLPGGAAVFDLVYVPSETPLLAAARRRGLRGANGAGMLVAQAEAAFERWTGVAGAGPVMRTALDALLAEPGG
ncbi:MAG: shikimate dehydrogenase [Acidimicrobiia bacterium]